MGKRFLKSSQLKNNNDLVLARQESMRSMILIQDLRLSESRDHLSWPRQAFLNICTSPGRFAEVEV
jgi:hypothetical protein